MGTFSTVPSGIRARSKTSASGNGLPAGHTMRAEYVPPGQPPPGLAPTPGRAAKGGEPGLDCGSDGGAPAACLGTGVLMLGRAVSVARDRRAAPGPADDPG